MQKNDDGAHGQAAVGHRPGGPDEGLGGHVIRFDSQIPPMTTEVSLAAGAVTIRMCGELDLATTEQLSAAVELQDQAPYAGHVVTLDLTGVTFIDSTGLREILLAHAALGSRLRIWPSDACGRLFRLAGVESRLPIEMPGSDAIEVLEAART